MKFIYVALFFLSIASVAFYTLLKNNAPGYCKTQERYISDEEFIGAAVSVVRVHARAYEKKKSESSFFANWNGYIPSASDTNCCVTNRRGTQSIYRRIFGSQLIEVWVSPTLKNKTGHWANIIGFKFDVCGALIDSDLNVRSSDRKLITTKTLLKEM